MQYTATMNNTPAPGNEPFCSNCGYVLTNLVQSSKCPECGRPLVEVLTRRHQFSESGKRYRSKATLFGLPVIDIAVGPKHGEMRGKACGFIAIGDMATGWLAIGGMARGLVAIGGIAIGGFSIGGLSLGLLTAVGGAAIGGVAAGGGAVGGIASGGGALGFVAQGGGAVGYYARGGGAWGVHTAGMPAQPASPEAMKVFDSLSWFFGAWPPNSISSLQSFLITAAIALGVGALLGLVAWAASRRREIDQAPWPPR
jgi:predicted RNA-binding Zn-ribbon protein involved in translation (DUF1610 family)